MLGVCLGCGPDSAARKRISPEYDQTTGKLKLLKYDSNSDGKVDTWSYMDGTRVLRIEIDKDEDGKIDRWEYYDADQKLEKTGVSRGNDGKEDAWSSTWEMTLRRSIGVRTFSERRVVSSPECAR